MKSKIKIQNPCSEIWETMTDIPEGKFCEICSKKVWDFTEKSSEEIENILLETMYDLPTRTDVGTVVINEAVINDKAAPIYLPERQPKKDKPSETKVDLKVIESKSA